MSTALRATAASADPAAPQVTTSPRPAATLKPRCGLKVAVAGNRRFGGETDEAPTEAAGRMRRQGAAGCAAVWEVVVQAVASVLETRVPVPAEHQRADDRPLRGLLLADFYAPGRPRLAVLGSLAAGSDQIAAAAALEVGRDATAVDVELEAVLPFPERDYPGRRDEPRPEFRREETTALASLAAQARQVVRLDGEYGDAVGRHRAYRQARDMVLQHADLLLAVYDPFAPARPAGTVETVERALAAGLTVVALLVAESESRVAVYESPADRPASPDREWAAADPVGGGSRRGAAADPAGVGSRGGAGADAAGAEGWRGAVAGAVCRQLVLPRQLPLPGESEREREQRLESLAEGVNRLRLAYGEAPPHRWCRGPVWRRVFGAAWRGALRAGAFFDHAPDLGDAPRTARAEDAIAGGGASRPIRAADEITMAPYAAYYDRASALADAYMRTYRGAFVLAFTLAGVAVAAAVMLMVASQPAVADWMRGIAGSPEGWLMAGQPPLLATIVLGGAKIGIILFLLAVERVSHQARYQEHATDFRYLAEKLRPMQWLAPAGTLVPAVDLPAHLAPQDPRRGWMPWLVRAVARGAPPVTLADAGGGPSAAAAPSPVAMSSHEAGSPDFASSYEVASSPGAASRSGPASSPLAASSPREVTLDADSARAALERAGSQWLEGQIRYHAEHARRMHGLDHGLERLAKILLWTVLIMAGLAVLLKLVHPLIPVSLGQAPFVLGAIAAFLPAFIAALGGIMFQSEARRLRSRSEAMYHALWARQRELRQQVAALSAGRQQGGAAWSAALHLRELARMMIEETGDWKVLYESHEIHAG